MTKPMKLIPSAKKSSTYKPCDKIEATAVKINNYMAFEGEEGSIIIWRPDLLEDSSDDGF